MPIHICIRIVLRVLFIFIRTPSELSWFSGIRWATKILQGNWSFCCSKPTKVFWEYWGRKNISDSFRSNRLFGSIG